MKFSSKRDQLDKRFGVREIESGLCGHSLGLAYCPANMITVGLSRAITLRAVSKPRHINLPAGQ